jgi:hypothetical protein
LYSLVAQEFLKENPDPSQAREVLDEMASVVAKAPSTIISARALWGVAYLYIKIDTNRAMELLGEAVKCLNRLDKPDFSSEYVQLRVEGKEFAFYRGFATPGFNPEIVFRTIGRVDFDGALYQASNFSDKSLRAMTTLALVEPCLKETVQQPKPKKAKSS